MELMQRQKEGVEFIQRVRRVFVNDPIGTGKTIQAIAAVKDYNKILVVCPSMVRYTWRTELEKMGEDPDSGKWMVINFEKMLNTTRFYKDILSRFHPEAVIIDECHGFKNRKAMRTQSATAFIKQKKPSTLLTMTATPVIKGVTDYWACLHMLYPKQYSSFWAFAKKHANARPGQFGWEWDAVASDPTVLMEELKPFYLCRPKDSVDLPPITYNTLMLDPTSEQKRLLKELTKQVMVEIGDETMYVASILARFTRLRQVGVSPQIIGSPDIGAKIPALLSISESTTEKIVVFSSFVDGLKIASKFLDEAGISNTMLVGEMNHSERDTSIRRFLWGPTQIMLASIELASAGMNLQEASVVVFLDQSMSPAINEQAVGRVYRHGQIKPVTVYTLELPDSIDSRILKILSGKIEAIDGIVKALKQIREDDSW